MLNAMRNLGRRFTAARRLLRPRSVLRLAVFWVGAIGTGIAAVAFAGASDFAQKLFHELATRVPLFAWVAPPAGFACVAWLTRRYFPGSQGSGIPQTIAALGLKEPAQRDRLLSMRIASGKLLLTTLGLTCGASIGREGPTVQVGASIMHSLGRLTRFSAIDVDRGLILAGGAAGVAAAFNTPLAGIVFAVEELSRSFESRTSGTILTTVIIAGVASVALVGNYTYFGATRATITDLHGWLAVPACGIAGGLCGGLFARIMISWRRMLPASLRILSTEHPVIFALACGVLVAAIGALTAGATFGTGYTQARALVQQEALPGDWFALAKAGATLFSYFAGIPAGIFAPSLAIGAGLGGTLSLYLPFAPGGVLVVLTMAAYFSGVVQAPLTALVIVGEMTNSHDLTLPLMAVVMIGRASSALVCRQSLYRVLAMGFSDAQRRASGPPGVK